MKLLLTSVIVLGLIVSEKCAETDIGSMEWRGQKMNFFNTPTALFVQSDECLPGFFKGFWQNESCYMFVTAELTRGDANAFCQEVALGNGLVAIPTELHQAYFVSQIVMQPALRASSFNYFWTSGENVLDGVWTWSTTLQPFNYTKFWSEDTTPAGFVRMYDSRSSSVPPYYDWSTTTSTTSTHRSICQQFIVTSESTAEKI